MDYTILILCLVAFAAGFIDAIVGGGGLIQMPMGLLLLPNLPVSTVIGTLKIPSFVGTSIAAYQYIKTVKVDWKMIGAMAVIALLASFLGSYLLTMVNNLYMKPILLFVLLAVAIYTYRKKDFGAYKESTIGKHKLIQISILISIFIGFYDGFIGPGAGSFFILAYIALLKFDFLRASTYAKLLNMATNFGSIVLFLMKGKIIWSIALPMAASNSLGAYLGAKTAIQRGNKFIRLVFLFVVLAILIRFGYDVWNQFS